jgi:hypothetical protein
MAGGEAAKKTGLSMSVGEAAGKVKERFSALNKRLSALSRPKLIALAVAVGVFSISAGVVFGYLFNPYQPTPTPSGDLSPPSNGSTPETISQSGVLRKFKTSQDGVDYYLEKSDESQVLLTASELIDESFLATFEGLIVTVEGKLTKTEDGSKDVLRVEKIWLKQ